MPAAGDGGPERAKWDLGDGPRMEKLLSALQRNLPAHPDQEDGRWAGCGVVESRLHLVRSTEGQPLPSLPLRPAGSTSTEVSA